MARLAQLSSASEYRACTWDLKCGAADRAYWIDHFCEHLGVVCDHLAEQYPDADPLKVEAFRREYLKYMHDARDHPQRHTRIDVLTLDAWRARLLDRFGFHDPYLLVKQRETRAALHMWGALTEQLRGVEPEERCRLLARGLLAGNLFDLGALATVEQFRDGQLEFFKCRDQLPPRPWLRDDLDAWVSRLTSGPAYHHAAVFVDNAGADIVLGCLPLCGELLSLGTRVTLAANESPALNDITATELQELVESIAARDPRFDRAHRDERLRVVSTGGDAPLLDLERLDPACVEAIRDADLIVLLGMGRSVESNADARFTCDCLRSAILKDAHIAEKLGGKLFDCVFRFEVPSPHVGLHRQTLRL